jgi:hypothetical protein
MPPQHSRADPEEAWREDRELTLSHQAQPERTFPHDGNGTSMILGAKWAGQYGRPRRP